MTDFRQFLNGELERKLPGTLTRRFPQLPIADGALIPAAADLPVGVQYETKELMEQAGEALIYGKDSKDIPLINFTEDEQGYRVVTFATGVTWSHVELEQAGYANTQRSTPRDIVTRRTSFVPRVLAEAHQKFVLAGSAPFYGGNDSLGITGFFNDPNVPSENSSYDPTDSGTTALDSIAFINDLYTGLPDRTNDVAQVSVIVVPERLRNYWATQFLSGTSVSVLESVLSNLGPASGGTLRGIVSMKECKSEILEEYGIQAEGTDKDLVMVAPVAQDAASRSYNNPRTIPLDYSMGTYTQIFLQDIGQVRMDFPTEFEYRFVNKITVGI
jgi:hypothetical protein